MSILDEAYKACKKIQSLDNRKEIQALINSWSKSNSQHSMLEYMSRGVKKQFLSFLVVYRKKDELARGPIPVGIQQLDAQDIKMLEQWHLYIQNINSRCIESLFPNYPTLKLLVDPYRIHKYEMQCTDITLPDLSVCDGLVEAFKQHHAASIVRSKIIEYPQFSQINIQAYLIAINKIRHSISNTGLFGIPKEISDLNSPFIQGHPEKSLAQLMMALISVQDSLENLDQLLYQAFVDDSLVTFDNDNIIEINKSITNYIGESLQLLIQPLNMELLARPGDLAYVSIEAEKFPKKGLFKIYNQSIKFLSKYGTTEDVGLRGINEDLSTLFHRI